MNHPSASGNVLLGRRRALWLLSMPGAVLLASCTQAAHAYLWIAGVSEAGGMELLIGAFTKLGWMRDESSSATEIIYRNPAFPSTFVTWRQDQNEPLQLVFGVVGRGSFTQMHLLAYRSLTEALVQAFGAERVRSEQVDAAT